MEYAIKIEFKAADEDEARWVKEAQRIIERLNGNSEICSANKQLVYEFCMHLKATKKRKLRTLVRQLYFTEKILKCLPPEQELLKLDRKGVDQLVDRIDTLDTLSEGTKAGVRFTLKQIFRWSNDGETPKVVRDVETVVKVKRQLGESDILTQEECDKLVANAGSLRNMAMLALCTSVPLRPHEVVKMKRSDFHPDEDVPYITVPQDTKTGARRLYIPKAAAIISQYLTANADIKNDDYLFESYMGESGKTHHRKRMTVNGFDKMFKVVAERIGLPANKRYLYVMRHTMITFLHASAQVSNGTLEKIAGWVPGGSTRMLKTYSHISDIDVRDAQLRVLGITPPEEKPNVQAMIACPRCREENPYSTQATYCRRCGQPLDYATMVNKMNAIEKVKEAETVVNRSKSKDAELAKVVVETMQALQAMPKDKRDELLKKYGKK